VAQTIVSGVCKLFFGYLEMVIIETYFSAVELQPLLLDIQNIYLAVIGFGFSSAMLVYGSLVYYKKKQTSDQLPIANDNKETILKLTSTVLIISATLILGIIHVLIGTALNVNATPLDAIIAISIAHILELTSDVEMLYLMTPKSSSSRSSLPSESPVPPPLANSQLSKLCFAFGIIISKQSSDEEDSSKEIQEQDNSKEMQDMGSDNPE